MWLVDLMTSLSMRQCSSVPSSFPQSSGQVNYETVERKIKVDEPLLTNALLGTLAAWVGNKIKIRYLSLSPGNFRREVLRSEILTGYEPVTFRLPSIFKFRPPYQVKNSQVVFFVKTRLSKSSNQPFVWNALGSKVGKSYPSLTQPSNGIRSHVIQVSNIFFPTPAVINFSNTSRQMWATKNGFNLVSDDFCHQIG